VKRLALAYIPRFGVRIEKGGAPKKVDLVEKLLLDLAKRFQGRPGGYTRIIKFGPRRGDNAPMSVIEFVGDEIATEKKKSKAEAKPGKGVKAATTAEPTAAAKTEERLLVFGGALPTW